MGNTAITANAEQMPASDKGGNPEVVQHGVNGVLVPYVDVSALRDGIQQLLDNRTDYAQNSQAGLDRFSFQTMVDQTDQTLRQFLG